jgi:hypothetical protein
MNDRPAIPTGVPARKKALIHARGYLVTVVMAGTIGAHVAGMAWAVWVTFVALSGLIFIGFSRLSRFSKLFLIATTAVIAVIMLAASSPYGVWAESTNRAGLYAAFFAAVMFMREPAGHSAAFMRVAEWASTQTDRKRYVSFMLGSHLISLMISMGAIALLGALTSSLPRNEEQLKGPALATLHGFFTTSMWSPLSVTPAIVLTYVTSANHAQVLAIGLTLAAVTMLASYIYNEVAGVKSFGSASGEGTVTAQPGRLLDFLQVMGSVVLVFAVIQAATKLLHIGVMAAVSLAVPCFVIFWISAQSLRDGSGIRKRITNIVIELLPRQTEEIIMMACCGAIGAAAASHIADNPSVANIFKYALPSWAVLLGVFWIIIGATFVGLSGLVSAAVLLGAIPGPEQLGVSPNFYAIVFITAWACSAQTSPLTPTHMTLANFYEVSARKVAYSWNRNFCIFVLTAYTAGILAVDLLLSR